MMQAKLVGGLIAGLAIMALVAAVLMYRGNSIKADARANAVQEQLNGALKVNGDNAKAFRQMQLTQENNDKLLTQLAINYTVINDAVVANRATLKQVAAQNAEVKALLNTRLPASLSGLLNGSANSNGNQGPSRSAAH